MAVKIKIGKCSKELGQWPVRHSRPPGSSVRGADSSVHKCVQRRGHTPVP